MVKSDRDTLVLTTSDFQTIVLTEFTFYNITQGEVKNYIESSITDCERKGDKLPIQWEDQYESKLDKGLVQKEYTNLKLLPLSFLSFALSYNFFSEAADVQSSIDEIKNITITTDTSQFESRRDRYYVMGSICAVIGLVNTFISLKPIEVRVDQNSVNMSYAF